MSAKRICLLAALSTACLRTVGGPDYAHPPAGPLPVAKLRVVYSGPHLDEPEDFVPRLRESLARELAVPLQFEEVLRPEEDFFMQTWPVEVSESAPGERVVVIRAVDQFRCGNPAFAGALLSFATLGLFPFGDRSETLWTTEIRSESGPPSHVDFEVEMRVYGWLPLLPVMPVNILWRQTRGDEHDYFLRVYPSHLHTLLAADEAALGPAPRRDADEVVAQPVRERAGTAEEAPAGAPARRGAE